MNLRFFLIASFFLITFITIGQSLNGTYTIGGSSPDFGTFNSAITALTSKGVSGPVIFNVRKGKYNEKIKIQSFNGSSITNTVTFQSESGNPEDVILHDRIFSNQNELYILKIDGADFITFQNMTIITDHTTQSYEENCRVIYITNSSDNLNFINNRIISFYYNDGFLNKNECIYVGNDNLILRDNDSILFLGNYIQGGKVGLRFDGEASFKDEYKVTGWVIENNVFTDQGSGAIDIRRGKNIRIRGNKIVRPNLNLKLNFWTAININYCNDTLLIDKNDIQMNGEGTGINLFKLERSTISFKQISNNMISFGPESLLMNAIAIKTQNTCPTLIAHNSVNMYGSKNNSGTCLYSYGNDSLTIYNNHFISLRGQPAYMLSGTKNQIISNYNNLFSAGSNLVRVGNKDYLTLDSLYDGTGLDKNSLSFDPLYFSNNVLIPYSTHPANIGLSIKTVPDDFYGKLRSFTSPSIGVFEGGAPLNDVALISSSLNNYIPCPNDTIEIYIRFKNKGLTNLNSLELYYKTNGTNFGPINWSGSLKQNDEDSILIKNVVIPKSTQVSFEITCSKPNGGIDEILHNDMLFYKSLTAMKGTYTIGKNGKDFLNFNDAVSEINSRGVCGPVIFEVDSGKYYEQLIIPKIKGTTSINTITFRSATLDSSDVEIWFLPNQYDNYVILYDGANYVNFEHLKISSLGDDTREKGIVLRQNASYNRFSNCWIKGRATSENDYKALVHCYGTLIGNKFHRNHFENGGYQIWAETNTSNHSKEFEIIDNIFEGNAGRSIFFNFQKDYIIKGNLFKGNRSSWESSGIGLSNCDGNFIIEKNKFESSGRSIAISFEDCLTTSLIFKNNFVLYAMNISNSENVYVVNNSFNYTQLMLLDTKNLHFYNNALLSAGTCLYSTKEINIKENHMDYNSYYFPDTYFVKENDNFYTFEKWRLKTGFDKNSQFVDPLFTSKTDLHIQNATKINQAGIPLSMVVDDIDGEPRNVNAPDIGADEFTVDSSNYYDIRIYSILQPDTFNCKASDSIKIKIINNSNFTMNSFVVKWSLFKVSQDSLTYNINIPAKDTLTLTLTPFHFTPNTYYEFDFIVLLPNGKPDNYFNDNRMSIRYQILDKPKIKQRVRKDCNSNVELYITNSNRAKILWSTGETTNRIFTSKPGTYNVKVTDRYGCSVTDNIEIK
jgi:hypothetical protein